jgi:hypothetical protein
MALPRQVRSGTATFRVGGQTRKVPFNAGANAFTVPVAAGQSVELLEITDHCGNST